MLCQKGEGDKKNHWGGRGEVVEFVTQRMEKGLRNGGPPNQKKGGEDECSSLIEK